MFSPYDIQYDFAHLHVHSAFSIRDGLQKPSALVDQAKKMGFPAIALTDHGNMGGHFKFASAAANPKTRDGIETGPIKAIFGIEAYLCEDINVKEHINRKDNMGNVKKRRPKHYHVVLLAKNDIGYDNLKIMSKISAEEGFYYEPRIDWNVLSQYSEGLICSSACLAGEIAFSILSDNEERETLDIIDRYKQVFKDDFYLEVQSHYMDEEVKAYTKIMEFADEMDIPIIATNDIHYITKDEAETHEIFVAMRFQRDEEKSGGSSDNRDLSKAYKRPEFYMKSSDEMVRLFEDRLDAIKNTLEIVEKCEFKYKLDNPVIWPKCVVEDEKKIEIWRDKNFPELSVNQAYLLKKSMAGLKKIGFDKDQVYIDRLKHEWNIIFDLGYEDYFITQLMVCEKCEEKNILIGPGRGCLSYETPVLTDNGYKPLGEVKTGDSVYSHTGNLRKVLNTMEYNISNENLLEIKTSNSFKTIKMTKDHKVYGVKRELTEKFKRVSSNTQKSIKKYKDFNHYPEWYKISDLNIGDLIFMPFVNKKDRVFSDIDLSLYIEDNKKYCVDGDYIISKNYLTGSEVLRFNKVIKFDSDFMYFIGRWIGDGWIVNNEKKRKNLVGLAFNTDDIESIDKIKKYLSSLGFNVCERYAKNKKLLQMIVNNKLLVKLLIDLFPDYKSSSNTKYIGDLKYINKTMLIYLLNGLIGADGFIDIGKDYSRENIDTTSLRLANEIRECLLYLQIPSYISVRKSYVDKRNPNWICKESYKIRFIGVNTNRKNKDKIFNNGYYTEIREMNEVVCDKVYDIEVEKDHSYLTSNYAVHNSGCGSLALYSLGITKIDPIKNGLIFERFLNPGRGSYFDHKIWEDKERIEI